MLYIAPFLYACPLGGERDVVDGQNEEDEEEEQEQKKGKQE